MNWQNNCWLYKDPVIYLMICCKSPASIMALEMMSNKDMMPWPSGYELRLSLERLRVLILVKVIGG